jgi:hypothetical protein
MQVLQSDSECFVIQKQILWISNWHFLYILCKYCCFQIPCVGLGDLCVGIAKTKERML